jgi:hypothetical protein
MTTCADRVPIRNALPPIRSFPRRPASGANTFSEDAPYGHP